MRASAALVDQVARLRRQRAVQRDEVGALEQLLERHAVGAAVRATSIPKPSARRATAWPMRPKPTMPSVAPVTSAPSVAVGLPGASTGPRARRARPRAGGGRARAAARRRGRRSRRSARRACCRPGCRARSPPRGRRCRCRPRSWRSRAVGGRVEQRRVDGVGEQRQQPLGARRRARAARSGVGGRRCGQTSTSCASIRRSSAGPGRRRVTKQRAIARSAFWWLGLPHVSQTHSRSSPSQRLLAVPTVALGGHQERHHADVAQGRGHRSPSASARRSRARSRAPGQVYVHVCKSKKKDKDGRHLHQGGDPAGQEEGRQVQRQAEVLRLPRVLAQLARHLLLAGVPHRVRRGSDLTDCRQEGRSSSSRSADARPHRLLRLELRELEGARSTRRACRRGGGWSTTPRSSTPSRSTRPSTGSRRPRRSTAGCTTRRRTSCSRSRPAAT